MGQLQPRSMPTAVSAAVRAAPPERFLEIRLAEMHRLVERMAGDSTADRLHALRESFPDVPLQHRVAALMRR